MKIVEYESSFSEKVKDLLVELQEYVVKIDKYKLNIISPFYREEYFKKMMEEVYKQGGKVFVAVLNDEVVGFIAGVFESYDEFDKLDFTCPKRGIIKELIVSEKCRVGGIGSKLIQKMEDFFVSSGVEYILLDVFAYNENAKKFYAKKGYEERMITYIKKVKND